MAGITFSMGGVYEVVAEGTLNGASKVQNVYQLQKVDGGTLSQALGLADIKAWLALVLNVVKAVQTTLLVWETLTVNTLEGDNTTGSVPLTASIAGTATGDYLPAGVAMLAYMNTGVRRRQLRKYIPGTTEGTVTAAGIYGTASTAIVAGMGTYLLNDYVGANGSWRYGHYRRGFPGSFVFPTSLTVTTNPSYQRRRRLGRGI